MKKLKFEKDEDEKDESVYNVLGQYNAKIGTICKGKFGWQININIDTWWTKDCLMEVVKFMGDLN